MVRVSVSVRVGVRVRVRVRVMVRVEVRDGPNPDVATCSAPSRTPPATASRTREVGSPRAAPGEG